MNWDDIPQFLPAILGVLRQEQAEGTLSLEQNDGRRFIYWEHGNIVYLQSDVVGEQFGNYLLRQGILDLPALNEILSDGENTRLGERVIQAGLMTRNERDSHLRLLQEQIMIHSLEHHVVEIKWEPGSIHEVLGSDLQFQVNHHDFIWRTFIQTKNLGDICDLLYSETTWQWEAPNNLLTSVCDLPLNPKWAFALSFFGNEPIGFETFIALGNLDEHDAARLIVTLWALGSLSLTRGNIPKIPAGSWKSKIISEAQTPLTGVVNTGYSNIKPSELKQANPTSPITSFTPRHNIASINTPVLSNDSNAIAFDALPTDKTEFKQSVESISPPSSSEDGSQTNVLNLGTQKHANEPKVADSKEFSIETQKSQTKAKEMYIKAKSCISQDRISDSIRFLEQAVQLDPDSDAAYDYWLLLGKLRLSNPAWSSRSIDSLQKATRLQPNRGEPWSIMGEIYLRKGFLTNATACFKKAIEIDPSIPVPEEFNLLKPGEPTSATSSLFDRLGNGIKYILGRNNPD